MFLCVCVQNRKPDSITRNTVTKPAPFLKEEALIHS